MDRSGEVTADTLVNELEERALARIIAEFGEERFAARIARRIVEHRPLHRTVVLADVVRDAVPHAARRHGPHPATRTFQALRIAVNAELESLAGVLDVALTRLMPGGVAVVLSYHSLEDRPVKRAFAAAATGCICPPDLPVCACGRNPIVEHLVRRPARPSEEELASNPRASAARLRAVRRLPEEPR
jgi:16S rRNA (cytosine1402-N4)-methyltransferase